MALPKRFDREQAEGEISRRWQEDGVYHFDRESDAPVYSIDTPPPYTSGNLHLGHVYSYTHSDLIARFRRMRGDNVFYPMGFDDNGLPTERMVERRLGINPSVVGRRTFTELCLEVSRDLTKQYQAFWQRLGLSVDWRYSYDTIDDLARRTAQLSFIDLYEKGLTYRSEAPVIWCPECRTALAQADVNDLERESEFVRLPFRIQNGDVLPVATTRAELLPACVAVFVHPEDRRFADLAGQSVTVPLFGQEVPVLTDPAADPEKGTGAVMCCTFGDTADVEWWYTHGLPLRSGIDPDGRLTELAGEFAGASIPEGRRRIEDALQERGELLARSATRQTVRVHERCDTPVEYIVTRQWFIRLLDRKEQLLAAGEQVNWHPEHMKARYREWVQNLRWDWLISRQRFYGVPFPVWYCQCGQVLLADPDQLPVDPTDRPPPRRCECGSEEWTAEQDVMDTWATSSLTPQIVGRRLTDPDLYCRVFPMSLRPQAHEIIRSWAFYTIVQSQYHFDALPWKDIMISGWGLAPQGSGKISKSKGSGSTAPAAMVERFSADAVRYWAASTGLGKDAVINEEKIQAGRKLVYKLWNVAKFGERFLEGYPPPGSLPALSPADRWILDALQDRVARVTRAFEEYDYLTAKNVTETFFWHDLADNYLEMAKRRLYDAGAPLHAGALYTLHRALLTVLQLFAPILPYISEQLYWGLFREPGGTESIHRTAWPHPDADLIDPAAGRIGALLVEIATAIRRYKSHHGLSLGAELGCLQIETRDAELAHALTEAREDILSVTRAADVRVVDSLGDRLGGGTQEMRVAADIRLSI